MPVRCTAVRYNNSSDPEKWTGMQAFCPVLNFFWRGSSLNVFFSWHNKKFSYSRQLRLLSFNQESFRALFHALLHYLNIQNNLLLCCVVFFCQDAVHVPSPIQSARAANIIHALFLYRKQILKEKLEPVGGYDVAHLIS